MDRSEGNQASGQSYRKESVSESYVRREAFSSFQEGKSILPPGRRPPLPATLEVTRETTTPSFVSRNLNFEGGVIMAISLCFDSLTHPNLSFHFIIALSFLSPVFFFVIYFLPPRSNSAMRLDCSLRSTCSPPSFSRSRLRCSRSSSRRRCSSRSFSAASSPNLWASSSSR